MAAVVCSQTIHAAPEAVFALFTDFEHAAGRIKGIKKIEVLTPGPVGPGTRFRETRVVFNRQATEEMEITRFEPGRGYEILCRSCGGEYRMRFDFHPEGLGTRVTAAVQYRAVSLLARLMAPLGWLMQGMLKKCLQADIDSLKQVAENPSVPA